MVRGSSVISLTLCQMVVAVGTRSQGTVGVKRHAGTAAATSWQVFHAKKLGFSGDSQRQRPIATYVVVPPGFCTR